MYITKQSDCLTSNRSNRKLEFNIVSSNYHLEITPSDVGNYDRVVIQDLLKEVAQTQQVDLAAKQRFKVVVINEADHLTRDAQAALRRTMEKYSPNLRLILLANSTSNIIAPIRSRCLLVRVAAPSEEEIAGVLARVGKKEGYKACEPLEKRIAKDSGRNLRRALLMFEAVHAQKCVCDNIDIRCLLTRLQRQREREDTYTASRLGSSYRRHRERDRGRTLTGEDSTSSGKALRFAHALYPCHNHSQGTLKLVDENCKIARLLTVIALDTHIQTHAKDRRRPQGRCGEMECVL